MRIKEIMTRNVECASPEDNLAESAALMRELDIGVLPVCGPENRLIGMLTDRDITVRATAGGLDPARTQVQDVMSPGVVYCLEDQDIKEAAQLMKVHQIRRLVVLNHDKRMVGIVSLGDLAVHVEDEALVGATLEQVSEPT